MSLQQISSRPFGLTLRLGLLAALAVACVPAGVALAAEGTVNIPRGASLMLAGERPGERVGDSVVPGVAAAVAQVGWTVPQTLIQPGFNVSAAGNARGVEAFVWEASLDYPSDDRSYVRAVLRLPDGRLTKPQTVSRRDQVVADAVVGVDARGRTTVVWTQGARARRFGPLSHMSIMAAVGGPGGRFGAPVRLGGTEDFGGAEPRLAVAPDRAAVVVWSRGDRLQAARRPLGRCRALHSRACFGRVQDLPGGADVAVVLGPRDTAYAAWAGRPGRSRPDRLGIQVAVAPRGERFGSPRTVSRRGAPASEPTIAIARDGSAVLAWRRSPPAGGGADLAGRMIEATVRDRDGRVSAPQVVAPIEARRPQVRLNRQGEAVLVWEQYTETSPDGEIAAAVRPAAGNFGPAVTISPPGVAGRQSLAVDRRGNAVAAWSAGGASLSVVAAVRQPGGSFGAPVTVAAIGGPPVTIAAGDRITAAWWSDAGTQLSDWTP